MDPINYQTQVQSPFAAALQGYQGGAAIRADQAQQTQLQAQRAQQLQMQQDLYNLSTKSGVTGQDYSTAMTRYPQLSEQLKRSWDVLNTDQQQSKLTHGSQAYAAIRAGRPDIAEKLFSDRAEAAKNSGDPKTEKESRTMADMIRMDPKTAATSVGLSLASYLGPEKFASTYASLGQEQRAGDKAPYELQKERAEATTADAAAGIKTVEAQNAPTRVGLENANAESVIADRTAGQRIAELNVQIGQANSETQRGQLVLERDKLISTQTEKKATEALGAQDGVDTIQRSLATVDTVMKDPAIDSFFTGAGTLGGKMSALIPGSSRKDLQGLVDTIKAQNFMTGIKQMQGMGALSNSEGDKVSAAVASLDLDQSPKAFRNALGVIKSTLERAQAKLTAGGKLPTTGGAFVMKVPRIGNVTEGDINKILAANPGSTREQAMSYLQSLTGAGQIPGR